MTDRPIRHLNQIDLARRWSLSHRTLERWRWQGIGPRYLKIGGRVVYRLVDIEDYEATHVSEAGLEIYLRASPTDANASR